MGGGGGKEEGGKGKGEGRRGEEKKKVRIVAIFNNIIINKYKNEKAK